MSANPIYNNPHRLGAPFFAPDKNKKNNNNNNNKHNKNRKKDTNTRNIMQEARRGLETASHASLGRHSGGARKTLERARSNENVSIAK